MWITIHHTWTSVTTLTLAVWCFKCWLSTCCLSTKFALYWLDVFFRILEKLSPHQLQSSASWTWTWLMQLIFSPSRYFSRGPLCRGFTWVFVPRRWRWNKAFLERGEKVDCDGFHRTPFPTPPPFATDPHPSPPPASLNTPPPTPHAHTLSHTKQKSPHFGGGDPSLDRVYDEFHWEFWIRSVKSWGEGKQLSDNWLWEWITAESSLKHHSVYFRGYLKETGFLKSDLVCCVYTNN